MTSAILDGVTVIRALGSVDDEVRVIRSSVAIARPRHLSVVRVVGEGAKKTCARVLSGDMLLRDGQVRASLLLDAAGEPLADAFVCNDDDSFLLFTEGMTRAALLDHLRAHAADDTTLEDLSASHAVVSIHGPFAWELLATLEGRGVLGFPFLSFYHAGEGRLIVRAGKTGEYGYDILVPADRADAEVARLLEEGAAFDAREVGLEAVSRCALENWFWNPHTQRGQGITPFELGLRWRVSERPDFVGASALAGHTANVRATAIVASHPIARGDVVRFQDDTIGHVLDAHRCEALGVWVAMALIELAYAYAGIDRYTVNGQSVRTTSAPFVDNLSLHVNPQKHAYARRAEIPFRGAGAGKVGVP